MTNGDAHYWTFFQSFFDGFFTITNGKEFLLLGTKGRLFFFEFVKYHIFEPMGYQLALRPDKKYKGGNLLN